VPVAKAVPAGAAAAEKVAAEEVRGGFAFVRSAAKKKGMKWENRARINNARNAGPG
jgi:hypothetical protein